MAAIALPPPTDQVQSALELGPDSPFRNVDPRFRPSTTGPLAPPDVGTKPFPTAPSETRSLKGVALIGASVATPPIPDADRKLAMLRATFRQCYERGLRVDPGMTGKVVAKVAVGPSGAVLSAGLTPNTSSLSSDVVTCIATAFKRLKFDALGTEGSTLTVPITFEISET
ncbi:MAG TPA: AgmX/PglI C-terminal domain-containing protein [Labilithrix sp.]|nr:AgmX/PglI C-terminal domain-containing protein [Labilithrix sp.]